jgi:transposase-like protein
MESGRDPPEVGMAFSYSTSVREAAGERVEEVAEGLEISAATLYLWKRQALIDVGRKPGVKSFEPDELDRSRRRIRDLETELALVKAACALFNGEEVVRPKGSARSSKG